MVSVMYSIARSLCIAVCREIQLIMKCLSGFRQPFLSGTFRARSSGFLLKKEKSVTGYLSFDLLSWGWELGGEGLQHTQSTRLSVHSSELGPPTPFPTRKCVSPSLGSWGAALGKGFEGPHSDEGTGTLVLYCNSSTEPWLSAEMEM